MRVLRKVTDVALSDGAVIKVHSNGAVDVAYDDDGSVGLSLTKEKDIFQLVGEDGNVKEKPVAVVAKKAKVSAFDVKNVRTWHAGHCSVHIHSTHTKLCLINYFLPPHFFHYRHLLFTQQVDI